MLQDKVLYHHFVSANNDQDHLQLVVPKSLQTQILEEVHGGEIGGHLGQ